MPMLQLSTPLHKQRFDIGSFTHATIVPLNDEMCEVTVTNIDDVSKYFKFSNDRPATEVQRELEQAGFIVEIKPL